MLKIGEKAPDFKLENGEGKNVSLSDFSGKKLVLYFYSKDSTSGCTKQALGFAEIYEKLLSHGIDVVGISRDSVQSHARFAEKYSLPFTLISDPDRCAIEEYGVWKEKKMCGKVGMGVVRTTYIIDESGKIEKIFDSVKADKSAADILGYFGLE